MNKPDTNYQTLITPQKTPTPQPPMEVKPVSAPVPNPTSDSSPAPKSHRRSIVLLILLFIVISLFVVFLLNKTLFMDLFRGIGYNPTPDMANVRTSLALTDEGSRIFNATHPILASREDFNESCESRDESVSVLGCYTNGRIYVYNIDNPSLPGIRESTSAHELLHAAWARLTGLERSKLIPLLESVYNDHAELKETIDSYSENEQLDELYVRIGTQIAELPDELEAHYSRFFANQDSIVDFYNSYIAPFNEIKQNIEKLGKELDELKSKIDAESQSLDSRHEALEKQIDEFNRCANTEGCFDSEAAFYARRSQLVAEQSAISAANDALNNLINSYNTKVETYNSSVLRSSELQDLINSNSKTVIIEDEE